MSDNWAPAVEDNPNRFDLDAEAVDANELTSRLMVDHPGKYHLEISGAKNKFDTTDGNGGLATPHILVPCVVLISVQGQSPAGAFHYHRVDVAGKGGGPMEDWQVKATLAFLQGVGLLKNKDGKVIDPETGTTQIKLSTVAARLENKQFIGDLRLEKSSDPSKYKDSIRFSFGRGAFPIDAAEVRSVPKNLEALKLLGMEHCMPPVAAAAAPAKETGEKKGKGKKGETEAPTPAGQAPAAPPPAAAPTPAMSGPPASTATNFDDL